MPALEIYDDKDPRKVVADFDHVILGRTGDIAIDDRVASRHHCEIRRSEIGYVLSDLKSRNGTILNLEPIDRAIQLNDGDEIGIGHATVRFWIDPDKANLTLPEVPLSQTSAGRSPAPAPPAKKPPQQQKQTPRPKRSQPPAQPAAEQPAPPPPAPSASSTAPPSPQPTADTATSDFDLQIESLPLPTPAGDGPRVDPGSLTIDDIIPLNQEGKPAHAVDSATGAISEAMLRLKELLLRGFQFRCTDIHIEPKENRFQLRYRIDGTLHALGTLEIRLVRGVYSIVKLLCNLDINARKTMLDGSFDVLLPDRRVQLRVSIAPSISGDKMVLRVLDTNLAPTGLDALSMDPYVLEQVRNKAAQNSSMIVVCGPTGSGKTTTVYAILREMDAQTRNIVTVEQPVEYKLESVSQIEVGAEGRRGNTMNFTDALRSLLRQDPDVILVGEIRDADTARMAVQSAMTGHLLLTTVHARDSIGCIFRLLDLGVESFLLASALTAVLSQRLMRRLCPDCKSKYRPAIAQLSASALDDLAGQDLYTAVGCDACLGIGYQGRVPIFELLSINDQVRDAIAHRPTIQQLRVAAGDWIFQTLREDGVRKLKAGLTGVEEFTRVAHQDN